jgi:ribonuclease D
VAFSTITTSSELQQAITEISDRSQFAIDLEFDKNRYRYGFNMCLMQIFDGDNCYLIDPLSEGLEISLIFPLLEDPDIQKVAFSFGEDIRLLHHMGCIPENIYDLSIASSLLDFPPISLTNLLDEALGIDVGKSSQQSNWFKRPLSDDQLNYAANDVLHLLKLKEYLDEKAEEQNIQDWIRQENKHFTSANYEDENHNEYLKEKDKGDLSKFEWFLFSKLMEFREQKAEQYNRPPYHLLDKKFLVKIASDPGKISQWKKEKSVFHKLNTEEAFNEVKNVLENAIHEAESRSISKKEKANGRMSPEEYKRYKDQQRTVNEAKRKIFKPIQKAMEKDLGKNAQIFILNNRMIKELALGQTENYLPYKQDLFEKYAEQLNLELPEVIEE